jgi:hypothetical protein
VARKIYKQTEIIMSLRSSSKSRKMESQNSVHRVGDIAPGGSKIHSGASHLKLAQSVASTSASNSNTVISVGSVNVVKRLTRQCKYRTQTAAVTKIFTKTEVCAQCNECGKKGLSELYFKHCQVVGKALCSICWERESRLQLVSSCTKQCFVKLTDVMKLESCKKVKKGPKKEKIGSVKTKCADNNELHSPQKFFHKEVGQTESSDTVQRPARLLRCSRQVEKSIGLPKKNVAEQARVPGAFVFEAEIEIDFVDENSELEVVSERTTVDAVEQAGVSHHTEDETALHTDVANENAATELCSTHLSSSFQIS